MSLPILVAIVAIGICLTVAAVHFTGGSKRATVADASQARRIFLRDFPDEQVGRVIVTADHVSAFLGLDRGRTGVVQSLGDGFITRIVDTADVASVRLLDPVTVSLRFRDFTWRGGDFCFADKETAAAIVAALDRPMETRI